MNNQPEFYDIYDYIYIPFWQTTIFKLILFFLAVLLFGIGIYFIIRMMQNKKEKQPSLWENVLQKLQKLSPTEYQTKEEFKQFYFTLTQIIKEYLEKRFHLAVVEKTDDEVIPYLRRKKFDEDMIQILEAILQGSLLIKFANANALRNQAEQDLEKTILLIKQTIPEEA